MIVSYTWAHETKVLYSLPVEYTEHWVTSVAFAFFRHDFAQLGLRGDGTVDFITFGFDIDMKRYCTLSAQMVLDPFVTEDDSFWKRKGSRVESEQPGDNADLLSFVLDSMQMCSSSERRAKRIWRNCRYLAIVLDF